jgi:carbonic anhydrase
MLMIIDCGMTHLTNESIKEDVRKRDVDGSADASKIDFGCFTEADLEKTILEDVETLKGESLLKGVEIRGFVLTTETGVLREL